ncbi:MAG TPA: hypothetical protein VGN15_01860, partial [Ktedonobacteraceae bacterium]|nr:hypothetical protein [Ktedonobacteraceae bacterium]
MPTRTVQPHVRRIPARPNSGSYPAQPVQPAPANSQEQMQGYTPATDHAQNTPSTPVPPTSLIRPVGAWTTQAPSPNPAQYAQTKMPVWPGQLPLPPQPAQPIEHTMQQQGRGSPLPNAAVGQLPVGVARGRPPLIEAHEQFAQDDNDSESYLATSVAAERWRTSWRNRQRSEAGPATSASRGQSLVQEPLMAMQNSLVRMRAIVVPKKLQESQVNLRFWITLLLMICIIGGLAVFIAATFQTVPDSASQGIQQSVAQPPNLSISGTPTATIAQGQSLHLHG